MLESSPRPFGEFSRSQRTVAGLVTVAGLLVSSCTTSYDGHPAKLGYSPNTADQAELTPELAITGQRNCELPADAAVCRAVQTGEVAIVYFGSITDDYAQQVARDTDQMVTTMTAGVVRQHMTAVPASPAAIAELDATIQPEGCAAFAAAADLPVNIINRTMPELSAAVAVVALDGRPLCQVAVAGNTVDKRTVNVFADEPTTELSGEAALRPAAESAFITAHEIGHVSDLGHEGVMDCASDNEGVVVFPFDVVVGAHPDLAIDMAVDCPYQTYAGAANGIAEHDPFVMAGSYGATVDNAKLGAINQSIVEAPQQMLAGEQPNWTMIGSGETVQLDANQAAGGEYVYAVLDEPVELDNPSLSESKRRASFNRLVVVPDSVNGQVGGAVVLLANAGHNSVRLGHITAPVGITFGNESQRILLGCQLFDVAVGPDMLSVSNLATGSVSTCK